MSRNRASVITRSSCRRRRYSRAASSDSAATQWTFGAISASRIPGELTKLQSWASHAPVLPGRNRVFGDDLFVCVFIQGHLSGPVTIPSMRRPVLSIPCANKAGDSQGGAALLWGEQPSSAAWGEPSRPGFPQRGNGKGGPISLLPQADCCPFVFESFAQSMIIFCVTPSLPTAKTPCFHSHSWSCLLRCLLVSSFFNRVLPSQNRTEASRFRDVRSRYSSQLPEPGDLLQKH
jgi:hypothetical protein